MGALPEDQYTYLIISTHNSS